MPTEEHQQMYERWLAMWNGEVELAHKLASSSCRIHRAPFGIEDPTTLVGPEGLMEMVNQGRSFFDDIQVELEVGPIAEADLLAARWNFKGLYKGGMPGASAPEGTPVIFAGIDFWRIDEDGMIDEYWVSSDGAYLMAQLGMLEAS
jgi:predicted ester cyclase